jgi:hypothetical protein
MNLMNNGHEHQSPLATLSMVAQQTAFQDSLAGELTHGNSNGVTNGLHPEVYAHTEPQLHDVAPPPPVIVTQEHLLPNHEIEDSLEGFFSFPDTGILPSCHFSSLITAEQPMPFFSPQSFFDFGEMGESYETQNQTQ